MKLTYLAHASLLVESGDVRLVTDPWLDGPTYLSAWWHFPEPAPLAHTLVPTHVYITHEHADHFHPPTLSRWPRSLPILIGKFASKRFRDKLAALGFTDVRELPHGEEITLGDGLHLTSYQYRADDTGLVLRDREATVFNLNDCLLRAESLAEVLEDHPRIDLLLASFANAEAYPIVYEFEDPNEVLDWDDGSRFELFLARVKDIGPAAFAPFASMFSFLAPDLFWLNDRIVSPAGLIERAQKGAVRAEGLSFNPGDEWTPERGHLIRNPLDWGQKHELLQVYAEKHAGALARLAEAEIVPGGKEALARAFAAFFRGFIERVPFLLRPKLDLTVRFDVTGAAGGVLFARFAKGKLDLTPPASKDAWDVLVTVPDWPLYRAVTQMDWWQHFGISCRFRVRLKKGARPREAWFWALLFLDDMGYLSLSSHVSARALGVAMRRRREVFEYARAALTGRFSERGFHGKFGG